MRFALSALLAAGLGLVSAIPTRKILVIDEFSTSLENTFAYDAGSFTIDSVTKAQFATMSAEQFSNYNAIVVGDLGDGNCALSDLSFIDASVSAKLAEVVTGNIFLLGTSITQEAKYRDAMIYSNTTVLDVVQDSLNFVTAGPATGLYMSLSCYYENVGGSPVSVQPLAGFGTFQVRSPYNNPNACSSNINKVDPDGVLPSSTSGSLSNWWVCSAAEVFNVYPIADGWHNAAYVTDAVQTDSTLGVPYLLSKPYTATSCGNGYVNTIFNEECDDGRLANGVGRSSCGTNCQCINGINPDTGKCCPLNNICGNSKKEVTSDISGPEQCDDGPDGSDTCDNTCQCIYGINVSTGECNPVPACGNGIVDGKEQCEPVQPTRRRDLALRGPLPLEPDDTCSSVCTCIYGIRSNGQGCNPVPACGNGVVDGKDECEPRQLTRRGLEHLNSREPAPVEADDICSAECKCIYGVRADSLGCNPVPACGNGVVDGNDECEPVRLTRRDLGSRASIQGDDICSSTCKCIYGLRTDRSGCNPVPACGNGVVDGDDDCEPRMLTRRGQAQLDAREPIQSDGVCSSQCKCIYGLRTNGECNGPPGCGNSVREGPEECDVGLDGSDVCSSTCLCIYGLGDDGQCKPVPVSTTSRLPTSTATTAPASSTTASSSTTPSTSRPASTFPPASSGSGGTSAPATSNPAASTSTVSSPVSSSPPSPSASNDPLPALLNSGATFVGCTGSELNYPSFSLLTSSDDMDLEMCTTACTAANRIFAGAHVRDCYCSDDFENVVTVARDLCSVPCPGNPLENCGGYRANATISSRFKLVRRQAIGTVPSNALLAIYRNAPRALPSSGTAPAPPASTLGPDDSSAIAPVPIPATRSDTATATAVVTAVTTATATSGGGGGCSSGFCHGGGYVFEKCSGLPSAGEYVFVIEACSCHGGWRYVPAGCDGVLCAGMDVYRAVEWNGSPGGNVDAVVYQPQTCTAGVDCVIFVQPSGDSGSGDNDKTTVVVTGGYDSGSSWSNGTVIVTAGASNVAGYLGSISMMLSALAMLI